MATASSITEADALFERSIEPYYVKVDEDDDQDRICYLIPNCPFGDGGCQKSESWKKAWGCRSYISPVHTLHYCIRHGMNSARHNLSKSQAIEFLKENNVEPETEVETRVHRDEYRSMIATTADKKKGKKDNKASSSDAMHRRPVSPPRRTASASRRDSGRDRRRSRTRSRRRRSPSRRGTAIVPANRRVNQTLTPFSETCVTLPASRVQTVVNLLHQSSKSLQQASLACEGLRDSFNAQRRVIDETRDSIASLMRGDLS